MEGLQGGRGKGRKYEEVKDDDRGEGRKRKRREQENVGGRQGTEVMPQQYVILSYIENGE